MRATDDLPALPGASLLSAAGSCAAIAVGYVALLHALGPGPRDAPATVRRRTLAVAIACALAWLPLWWRRRELVALTTVW